MAAAAALRLQIEDALATRFPAALTPVSRTIHEVAATGIPAADAMLNGGLPVGAISELVGPECSGRTSLALAFVARRTAAGNLCAWIDAGDAFDPQSAAASGVRLRQLLWVRCRDAASAIVRKREERPWTRLDQALRATDLLLQTGGFGALVLDLGDMNPAHGTRIPLASWFRFRNAADRSRCSLVVLGRASYAQSSAAVVVDCAPLRVEIVGGTVLAASSFQLSGSRRRFVTQRAGVRKPPASIWSVQAAWDEEKSA
ncbi:MAG: hypothetical protein ABSB60_07290 [Terracidiphilus sp.]|jgi:hypothetical protein